MLVSDLRFSTWRGQCRGLCGSPSATTTTTTSSSSSSSSMDIGLVVRHWGQRNWVHWPHLHTNVCCPRRANSASAAMVKLGCIRVVFEQLPNQYSCGTPPAQQLNAHIHGGGVYLYAGNGPLLGSWSTRKTCAKNGLRHPILHLR